MVIESEVDTNRPYPPFSNVASVLQRLRSRNLPTVIDEEYLRDAGIPEGTIGRTLFGLKFLKLINSEREITEAVKAIHTSTDEEYKDILSGLIRESYKEVFNAVDPSQDTQDKILNVFRRYTPASQRERLVVFFLGMCREAGIATQDVPKARSMGTKPSKQNAGVSTNRQAPKSQHKTQEKNEVADIAPALEGLIKSLPAPNTPMSKAKREQWIAMAEAVLKYIYPEESPKVEMAQGEENKETTIMAGH